MTFESKDAGMPNLLPESIFPTTDDFFNGRRDWLRVQLAEGQNGGYDIVLRIDGAYSQRSDALEIARSFARDIACLLAKLDPTKSPYGSSTRIEEHHE